jgi:hypothetical protein
MHPYYKAKLEQLRASKLRRSSSSSAEQQTKYVHHALWNISEIQVRRHLDDGHQQQFDVAIVPRLMNVGDIW